MDANWLVAVTLTFLREVAVYLDTTWLVATTSNLLHVRGCSLPWYQLTSCSLPWYQLSCASDPGHSIWGCSYQLTLVAVTLTLLHERSCSLKRYQLVGVTLTLFQARGCSLSGYQLNDFNDLDPPSCEMLKGGVAFLVFEWGWGRVGGLSELGFRAIELRLLR